MLRQKSGRSRREIPPSNKPNALGTENQAVELQNMSSYPQPPTPLSPPPQLVCCGGCGHKGCSGVCEVRVVVTHPPPPHRQMSRKAGSLADLTGEDCCMATNTNSVAVDSNEAYGKGAVRFPPPSAEAPPPPYANITKSVPEYDYIVNRT